MNDQKNISCNKHITWQSIWDNKQVNAGFDFAKSTPNDILMELLRLNGFDSKTGAFSLENYLFFIQSVFRQANLKDCKSIYEVGCGAGAFLYAINLAKLQYNKFEVAGGGGVNSLSLSQEYAINGFVKFSGVDYSLALIDAAKCAMKEGSFLHDEAKNINIEDKYDCVCSFSVFHYFPNLMYAREVIEKMIQKANKTVLFLDILDEEKKEADIAYKKKLCGDDYERLYGNLNHLYYTKSLFEEFASSYQCKVIIQDQDIPNYQNSAFRFNVIMQKE